MELNKMVESIAEELKAVYNGEVFATEEDEAYGLEVGEPISMWDYFLNSDSVLDIDYIVSSDRETLRGVRLLVAFGGPNIYINTFTNAVEGFWWTDRASAWIPSEVADTITEVFQELWNC